ncbi:MAG TPA: hypothetical protein ENO20_04545 [Bacteroides sp.]|nr:hypothetical protein [Bacteroides sp.]
MKKITVSAIILLLAGICLSGQDITGTWNGVLVIPGGQLRVDFHITTMDDGYTSTMDSPDQGAFGIPVTSTEFEDRELTITVTNLGIVYKGTLKEDHTVEGTFTQMGQSFDLTLTKAKPDASE